MQSNRTYNWTHEMIVETFNFLLKRNWKYCIQEEEKANHTPTRVKELIQEDLEDFDSLKVHLHFDKFATKYDIERLSNYVHTVSNKFIKLHKPNPKYL